jgi:hypothetical protein
MSPDRPVNDDVFTARVGLGLREIDGREAAPDVSSAVAHRLVAEVPDDARRRTRHWPLLAALLAAFVTAALWFQNGAERASSGNTPATAQDPQSAAAQQVLSYTFETLTNGSAATSDRLVSTSVALQQRLDGLATVQQDGNRLLVTTATGDVERVRSLIEGDARLELRPVATADYTADGIRFDLDAERKRLQGWLDAGGRDRLCKDPVAIREYRDGSTELRWAVRVVSPQLDHPDRWDARFVDVPSLAAATVIAHTEAEWNGGAVPPRALALPSSQRVLLELVAINMHAAFVDSHAVEGSILVRGNRVPYLLQLEPQGEAGVEHAKLTERWIGNHLAVLWNGELLSAPRIASKLHAGVLHCGSAARADTMFRMLGNPLPARLRFLGAEPAPK